MNGKENRESEWADLLKRFDPNDEDIRSSDYEGQAYFHDDIKNESRDMSDKVIAYHQLEADVSSHPDRKRKAPGKLSGGRIRHSGW
jgi:hypothetical protein